MFAPGTLCELIQRKTAEALQSGALQPIVTRSEFVEDAGVRFLVRVVSNRKDLERPRSQPGPESSPFLAQDDALYVADASSTHVCRLNRYPVIENHLLLITRRYEDQETALHRDDFEALWLCLRERDSLGFYNGGAQAGASQSHKHLQWVPLPLTAPGPRIPLEPRIVSGNLPFRHAFAPLDLSLAASPRDAARTLLDLYRHLLSQSGLNPDAPQPGAYNLLATRQWMLLVPRSRERFHGISLNALAFAGTLLVKEEAQLDLLKRLGPMAALRGVVE